jgi:hypothetical protein
MDGKLIWAERASSDIEAIVRYIAVAIQVPQLVSALASTIVRRSPFSIQKRVRSSTNCVTAAGASSSSGGGESFTQFVAMPSSSVESGLPQWVKPIWKHRSEFGIDVE